MNASVSHIIVAPASCRCRAGILPARVPRREASATAAETAALRMDQDQDAKYCRRFVLYLLGGGRFQEGRPNEKGPRPSSENSSRETGCFAGTLRATGLVHQSVPPPVLRDSGQVDSS